MTFCEPSFLLVFAHYLLLWVFGWGAAKCSVKIAAVITDNAQPLDESCARLATNKIKKHYQGMDGAGVLAKMLSFLSFKMFQKFYTREIKFIVFSFAETEPSKTEQELNKAFEDDFVISDIYQREGGIIYELTKWKKKK